jgi:hypothetical protein
MSEDRLQVQPIDDEEMAEIELLAKLILIASAADWCCQQTIDIALGAKSLPDEQLFDERLGA